MRILKWEDSERGTSCGYSGVGGGAHPRRARTVGQARRAAASANCGYPSSVQLDDGTIVTLYYGVGELGKPDDFSECGHGLMEYARCVRYREADLLAYRE